MSRRERRALNRLSRAMHVCRAQEFILEGLSTERPREIMTWAKKGRGEWARKIGREAEDARLALDELMAAAQGYADVHERASAERARQAERAQSAPGSAL